jgi:peptide deformylase
VAEQEELRKKIKSRMTFPIYVYGHPVLRRIAEEIDRDYPGLNTFIADMFETMYNSDGLGLAAPQVGKSLRLFVIDGEPLAKEHPEMKGFHTAFINPQLVERKGEKVPMSEGCLSLPGLHEEVLRESLRYAYSITIRSGTYDEVYEDTKPGDPSPI